MLTYIADNLFKSRIMWNTTTLYTHHMSRSSLTVVVLLFGAPARSLRAMPYICAPRMREPISMEACISSSILLVSTPLASCMLRMKYLAYAFSQGVTLSSIRSKENTMTMGTTVLAATKYTLLLRRDHAR